MNILSKIIILFCLVFSQAKMIHAQHQQVFSQQEVITKGRIWDVAFEDLNKDGFSDMAIADWFKPPTIYYNDRNGNFESFKSLSSHDANDSSYRVHGVGINDFNGDGNSDILAVFNGLNNLLYLSNDREFILTDTINTQNSDGLNISLGDIDLNGHMDIVCENTIWLNKGNLQFSKYEAFEMEGRIIGLWLNDNDNDKDLDLFYSSSIPEKGLVLLKNKTRAN